MTLAICDQDAFYPLCALVNGPFDDLASLSDIERFVRGRLFSSCPGTAGER
jgi:hypothetical protein